MHENEIIYGFQIKKIKEIRELSACFYEMEHLSSGAKLGWIKNKDENKTFSISFRTIPWDNSGVFHILEHSVLQGSKRYPVKAPFLHMMKNSLNTFLNAMTFPDKTMFPVSSRNKKDFENLMRIYMDAVFHPLLHENENIFRQEGWHYEFEEADNGDVPELEKLGEKAEKENKLIYNGVVLNEMKGDHSSVDSLLYNEIAKGLFPDTAYQYESGGDPAAIVELTYEEFCKAHKTFYHPSNAYILLDGDLEIKSVLQILDEEFLSAYERKECDFPLPMQEPVNAYDQHDFAGEEEGAYLGLAYMIGTYADRKKLHAATILADYLADSNESPLKKIILEKELAYDVSVMSSDDLQQPFLLFTIRNMDPDKREEIENIFQDTLEKIKEEGLDKEQLLALLCQQEFEARERDFEGEPSGVMNCMTALGNWLYGGDPAEAFETKEIFNQLRQEIEEGSFDQYLEEIFLKNTHKASVLMKPSDTYMAEEEEKEAEKLQKIFASCSEEEKKKLAEQEQSLKTWQAQPDEEETLQCMPKLSLEDISEEPLQIATKILSDGSLWHQQDSNGIRYLRIYFPIQRELLTHIERISFMSCLYGELRLHDMDKASLDRESGRLFGDFKIYLEAYPMADPKKEKKYYLCADLSYLQENEEEALALGIKILQDTDFGDFNAIADILYQEAEEGKQALIMDGHSMAMLQAKSALSYDGKLSNVAEGPAYVEWLDQLSEHAQEQIPLLAQTMQDLADDIFFKNENEILVSMTSDGKEKEYRQRIKTMLMDVPESKTAKEERQKGQIIESNRLIGKETETVENAEKKNEIKNLLSPDLSDTDLIEIPAAVAYTAMAGLMENPAEKQSGAWNVLAKLVSMDYLWNEVRVLGGAYGTGMSVGIDGSIGYYSYRDPNPENSLKVYESVPEFLQDFCKGKPDFSGIKIGTIADTEPLLSPGNKGKMADRWYLAEITDDYRKERRRQILNTGLEEIKRMAEEIAKVNMASVTITSASL
jgi:presequence protease